MGWPNCVRTLAYSTDWWSIASAAPTAGPRAEEDEEWDGEEWGDEGEDDDEEQDEADRDDPIEPLAVEGRGHDLVDGRHAGGALGSSSRSWAKNSSTAPTTIAVSATLKIAKFGSCRKSMT